MTYGALDERTDALAQALLGLDVEPGDRVAIFSRRSIAAVEGILATLKAGAAYVPVDPSYPPARIQQVLEASGARLALIGEGASRSALPAHIDVLHTDQVEPGEQREPDLPGPQPEQLAYVLFTSGSTGRPKGVEVDHHGLSTYLEWAARTYVRGERLRFPLFTSLSYDLTVTSLFLPLITGGCQVIYPESSDAVDSALLDVAAENRVEFLKLTPSHLSLLLQLDVSALRVTRVVVGGEDLRAHLARSLSERVPEAVEIYNEYGPTEAVVGCVVHRFDPKRDEGASVPIGLPADHVSLEVLNEAKTAVPVGVPGELFISSHALARGYHGREERTAESFEPHPERPGARRYRTGDLVRLGERGLEYLGRIDRQLKISGMRVEPGEVEAALLTHEQVKAAVVVGRRPTGLRDMTSVVSGLCERCGLPSSYPKAEIDESGVCGVCRHYDAMKGRAQAYFKTMDDLRARFENLEKHPEATHDCMMLLSGGKDSTYALCQLVEMGLSVYAFTFDNGFISEGAKDNMRKVTEQLGVPLEIATTPAMNAVFRDSLRRFSNVCNGCFKVIYTLSTKRAHELQIPVIVTGLSRGQMFETRLSEELFRDGRFRAEDVDTAVLSARKAYHRAQDTVSELLDTSLFQSDAVFDEIEFLDFYRFCDASLDEVFSYLTRKVPWVRPQDTGRSTNCLINDIGIYVHKRERGFHNYALPYSWDVRLGHKTREQAVTELNDEIDLDQVRSTLAEIGYEEREPSSNPRTLLEAFYVAEHEVPPEELREHLLEHLPARLVPASFTRIDEIPLTPSGKADEEALPSPQSRSLRGAPWEKPTGPVEEYLAQLWSNELGVAPVGALDHFFELGGTSIVAMEVMILLCREFDIDLPLPSLFERPVLRELAELAENKILDDVAQLSDNERAGFSGPSAGPLLPTRQSEEP